jgi:ABC-type sugar transport system permease subunit
MAARAAVARPPRRLGRVGATTRRIGTTWPYLVPALFFFVGWQLYPIVRVLWISFTDYHFLTGGPTHWVGLRNYTDAFTDPLVRKGLLRALIFTVVFLPGMVFFPMVLAVLVDRVRNQKAASTYRLILLIPAMIPGPLIFVLWGWLYSSAIGPINYFLVDVFHFYNIYNQPQWLGSSALVYLSLAMMEWWWGLGFHTLFYLAGLATIPKELYESARVDGASEWRIFWRITFPRLRPILLVLVVLRFGTAFALIDEYIILGGFNRDRPTYTWTVYMWDNAFQVGDWNQGFAAAVGLIGTIGMLAVVLWLFYVFRSRD